MNKYIVFYSGKQAEVSADTSYRAYLAGCLLFKVSRKNVGRVSVLPVEVAGRAIIHSTASL